MEDTNPTGVPVSTAAEGSTTADAATHLVQSGILDQILEDEGEVSPSGPVEEEEVEGEGEVEETEEEAEEEPQETEDSDEESELEEEDNEEVEERYTPSNLAGKR